MFDRQYMCHLVNSMGNPQNLYMYVSEKIKDKANKWPSFIPMLSACLTSLHYEKLTENVFTVVLTEAEWIIDLTNFTFLFSVLEFTANRLQNSLLYSSVKIIRKSLHWIILGMQILHVCCEVLQFATYTVLANYINQRAFFLFLYFRNNTTNTVHFMNCDYNN